MSQTWWKLTPSDILKGLLDTAEFEELVSVTNSKKSKEKKNFAVFWEAIFKGKNYKAGGFDEVSAREACLEKII